MPRKAFRVAIAAEPIEFDLGGPEQVPQNFKCRDRLAAGKLMKFAELFSSLEDEAEGTPTSAKQGAAAIPALRDFFNAALMPEARTRFWALIDDDEAGIPLDTMVEIAGWLAEVYAGERPTGPTSSGTSGATSTGGGSPASLEQPDTQTYSRSEPTPALTS